MVCSCKTGIGSFSNIRQVLVGDYDWTNANATKNWTWRGFAFHAAFQAETLDKKFSGLFALTQLPKAEKADRPWLGTRPFLICLDTHSLLIP